MPLTTARLAVLIRLQGAAEELLASARANAPAAAPRNPSRDQVAAVGDQLRGVIAEVAEAIADDQALSSEFGRVVPVEETIHWSEVEARASTLVGWLRGAVHAESLQMRIDAEARAYAEARVRAERPVGFGN